MKLHLETQCPFRIVKCSAKDCTFYDFARTISLHESGCVVTEQEASLQPHNQLQEQARQQNTALMSAFTGQ